MQIPNTKQDQNASVSQAPVPIPDDEFKLALTMAGAASAGCYTGGVMDYLFQILDLWERAKSDIKQNNENGDLKAPELKAYWKYIPRHKVTIDAMGGTSAGGMTSVMAAIYGINGKITPVDKPGKTIEEIKSEKKNIFYDSWVVMDDLNPGDKRETAAKIWDTKDLENNLVQSLLNSSFIDNIADRCFSDRYDLATRVGEMPGYISKDLQLILSHCVLRGIPLNVSFTTPIGSVGRNSILPDHTTQEHYVISHYHLNKGIKPADDTYFWLNPYGGPDLEMLRIATKATGAFPAGLLYREFDSKNFSGKLLERSIKRMVTDKLGTEDPDPLNTIKLKYLKDYSTVTVDGGAINNEPYREVNSLLRDKYGPFPVDKFPKYGVLMIDPFPDKGSFDSDYEKPYDLLQVGPAILGALVDQARVKRRELLENDSNSSFRSIIFPRKWVKIGSLDEEDNDNPIETDSIQETVATPGNITAEKVKSDPNPIACSAAMAFAGLLDIKFREHDFFLGRNNARSFFRYFFSFPYDKDPAKRHPIHRNWSDDMIEKFRIEKKIRKKVGGKLEETTEFFLPIIPDLTFLTEQSDNIGAKRYEYDIEEKPRYDPNRLFAMQPLIKGRFLKILNTLTKRAEMLEKFGKKRQLEKLKILDERIEMAKTRLDKLKGNEPSEKNRTSIDNKIKSIKKLEDQRLALSNQIKGLEPATNAGRWLEQEYHSSWFTRKIVNPLGNKVLGLGFLLFRKKIAGKLANSAIKKVLIDLDNNDCLMKK